MDDGSTDLYTLSLLDQLEKEGFQIIRQANAGPAVARNRGVLTSTGEFLLLLDSDNRIRQDYMQKALDVFKFDSRVGVVYGRPHFFGEMNEIRFTPGIFDLDKMLTGNYIDMCAVVRRKTWDDVDGLDENLYGCEDWELWIKIGVTDWKLTFLDEVLFDYRVRANSHTTLVDSGPKRYIAEYIGHKHASLIYKRYKHYYRLHEKYNESPFLFFLKLCVNKYIFHRKYPNK